MCMTRMDHIKSIAILSTAHILSQYIVPIDQSKLKNVQWFFVHCISNIYIALCTWSAVVADIYEILSSETLMSKMPLTLGVWTHIYHML